MLGEEISVVLRGLERVQEKLNRTPNTRRSKKGQRLVKELLQMMKHILIMADLLQEN